MNILPSNICASPFWQDVYAATLQETNIPKLFQLVETAEAAIRMRREDVQALPESKTEQQALEKALLTLSVIKREQLNFFAELS